MSLVLYGVILRLVNMGRSRTEVDVPMASPLIHSVCQAHPCLILDNTDWWRFGGGQSTRIILTLLPHEVRYGSYVSCSVMSSMMNMW